MEAADHRMNLKVQGMTCNHCATTVCGIIEQEGGTDVSVDYLMGEANFDLSDAAKIERITRRLTKAGYQASSDGMLQASKWSDVEKKFAFTLPFSLLLFSHMFAPHSWWINIPWVQLLLCLPVFILGAWHFGKSSYEAIRSGHINMDILILIGTTSAFVYSLIGLVLFSGTQRAHDFLFFETTSTIITLVLLGYVIEHRAVKQTTKQLQALLKSKPEKAKKLVQNGMNQDLQVVNTSLLQPKDIILVNAGDRVPADGIIKHGNLRVNEAMLTGEAEELHKESKHTLLAGSLVIDGNATVEVTKAGAESTIGQIIQLVKESRSDKPNIQKLADRVSSWFVPVIILLSISAFVLNLSVLDQSLGEAMLRSIALLVIACPCAMGLATPTAVSVGLGLAAKLGIIVKRASIFEETNRLKKIVFDKTGTLTEGRPSVRLEVVSTNYPEDLVRSIVRAIELKSNHPIAKQLALATESASEIQIANVEEIKGMGMKGSYDGQNLRIGSSRFLELDLQDADLGLMIDETLVAKVYLKDRLKPEAKSMIDQLKRANLEPIILSGDRSANVEHIAKEIGIQHFESECLPEQKLERIKELKRNDKVGMIGDGINDAPALAAADIGISIGNENALAADSASIVILSQRLESITNLFRISERTVQTIRQNLFWAFAYNIVAIPLAALGYLDPMLAALSMAFSDVIVIGNSLRLRLILPKATR